MKSSELSFNWADPLLLDQQLSEEERMVRDFCCSSPILRAHRQTPASKTATDHPH